MTSRWDPHREATGRKNSPLGDRQCAGAAGFPLSRNPSSAAVVIPDDAEGLVPDPGDRVRLFFFRILAESLGRCFRMRTGKIVLPGKRQLLFRQNGSVGESLNGATGRVGKFLVVVAGGQKGEAFLSGGPVSGRLLRDAPQIRVLHQK